MLYNSKIYDELFTPRKERYIQACDSCSSLLDRQDLESHREHPLAMKNFPESFN